MTNGLMISTLLSRNSNGTREVETGAGFALTYGPQKRIGSSRARIFIVIQEAPHFIPVTDWIVPQDLQ